MGQTANRTGVLVALTSLVAEGTPVMVLEMVRRWRKAGISTAVMTLFDRPDELRGELSDLGVPVFRAQVPRSGLARYSALVSETARICREVRPGAFLSMPFGWHAFMAMGARLAGVPVVAAHVGSYPPHWQGRAFWKFRTEVWLGRPFVTGLICCSHYVEAGVRRHFRRAHGPLSVVHNGVDAASITARAARARAARAPDGPFRIGMVGRLEESKDHETLLQAAAQAAREVDLALWLIGDGRLRGSLEARALELGLGARTRFLGSRRDVPDLLGQLDAFVFSVKPDEGLGIALIEALAARVPVIASDVGACREVLGVPAAGTLVPWRNAAALAGAIVRLAREGAPPGQAEAGFRRAEELFSTDAMAAGYVRQLGLQPRPDMV